MATKPPHKLNPVYVGDSATVLTKLRERGHDVSWYARYKPEGKPTAPTKCGYFTVYLLENEWAWTIDDNGNKYKQYRKLRQPVPAPIYGCSVCSARMDWPAAKEHRLQNLTNVGKE